MIKAAVFDFGRVLIFPRDEAYFGGLNDLNRVLSESPNYNFSDNFVFNQELIDFVKEKKFDKGFGLFLFTKGQLHKTLECERFFNRNFNEIFTCEGLKLEKNDPRAYLEIIKSLDLSPEEIVYIDDNRENTKAAEEAGLSTITFRNNMQFETEFAGYI